MEHDKPLKWKLKLTAELARGECVEYDVTGWKRAEEVTLGFRLWCNVFEDDSVLLARAVSGFKPPERQPRFRPSSSVFRVAFRF